LRRTVATLAHKHNLAIIAASTHPFSHWKDQDITPNERYFQLIEEMQQLARALSIYGLHVHVGVENREDAINIMNAARYFLPHILALSTSSPFWIGRDTGLKSYRSEVFKQFPRTDIPDYFGSAGEFDNYVKLLVKTKCIDNGKKIWWDVRPHPVFPTLEFRICDLPSRVDEVIAIAGLFQAIVAKLYKLLRQNMGFRLYRRALIQENKWRAVRYGLDGKLIDFGKQAEVPVRDLILELLEFIDDVVDELGSRKAIEYVHTILKNGTSADRQLRVYKETNDLNAVVDNLAKETLEGVL
jgi:carboxylate-amine ligase